MDRNSPDSILQWITFSLAQAELESFEALMGDTIRYGVDISGVSKELSHSEFMAELIPRLDSRPRCVAYTYRDGLIKQMSIFVSGWMPEWRFSETYSRGVIMIFTDQRMPEDGMYLVAAWLTGPDHENFSHLLYDAPCQ